MKTTAPGPKGRLLEEAVVLLFESIFGLARVRSDVRSRAEQIDFSVQLIGHPKWTGIGPYLLGECKNWSKAVEAEDIRAFVGKLVEHGTEGRTGVFVATGGYSKGAHQSATTVRARGYTLLLLDRGDMEAAVHHADRAALFADWHHRAVVGGGERG